MTSTSDEPCIWMSAGVVRYKLCDRGFDCEHCPLDAGLRSHPFPAPSPDRAAPFSQATLAFPTDRRYAHNHVWVLPVAGTVVRIGLDALAAALVGVPRAVRERAPAGRALARGDALCELDLGVAAVTPRSPVEGHVVRWNAVLDGGPQAACDSADGWLLEMDAPNAMEGLMTEEGAREHARFDLVHFRRRAALELLRDLDGVGATLPDGGVPVTDLRQLLGARRYLALVREILQ